MSQGLALIQSLDKQYKGLVCHGGLEIKPYATQEHWSGLPSPPPGDLSDPGIKPTSAVSPALQVDCLSVEPNKLHLIPCCKYKIKLFRNM